MISNSIINRLALRYGQDVVTVAKEKLEKKIADGSFKGDNDFRIERYLESMCEGINKSPKDRAQSFKYYRLENIFNELVKEKGSDWFKETIKEMKELPTNDIKNLMIQARGSYWYAKVKAETPHNLTETEQTKLNEMYFSGKTPLSDLTDEERSISDKVLAQTKEIENKALSEAMACIFEETRRQDYEQTREATE